MKKNILMFFVACILLVGLVFANENIQGQENNSIQNNISEISISEINAVNEINEIKKTSEINFQENINATLYSENESDIKNSEIEQKNTIQNEEKNNIQNEEKKNIENNESLNENKTNEKQIENSINEKIFISNRGERVVLTKENGTEIRVGNLKIHSPLDLETESDNENKTIIKAKLSNGLNGIVKIMPNTASEIAIEKLQSKNCNETQCLVELKETGIGNKTRVIYEVKTQKTTKILGLFKTQMDVSVEINPEDGEIIKINRPWWSFLSSK